MSQHKSQILNAKPVASPMTSEQIQDLRQLTARHVHKINAQPKSSVPKMGFHSGVSKAYQKAKVVTTKIINSSDDSLFGIKE